MVDIRIHDNRIAENAGPGILLALAPNDGAPAEAGPIEILRNRIDGNGTKETPPVRGGIVIEGGQADGKGRVRSPATRSAATPATGSAAIRRPARRW